MPHRLHQMKLRASPFCDFYQDVTICSFPHMIWQCPEINKAWEFVSSTLFLYMPNVFVLTMIPILPPNQ